MKTDIIYHIKRKYKRSKIWQSKKLIHLYTQSSLSMPIVKNLKYDEINNKLIGEGLVNGNHTMPPSILNIDKNILILDFENYFEIIKKLIIFESEHIKYAFKQCLKTKYNQYINKYLKNLNSSIECDLETLKQRCKPKDNKQVLKLQKQEFVYLGYYEGIGHYKEMQFPPSNITNLNYQIDLADLNTTYEYLMRVNRVIYPDKTKVEVDRDILINKNAMLYNIKQHTFNSLNINNQIIEILNTLHPITQRLFLVNNQLEIYRVLDHINYPKSDHVKLKYMGVIK